MSREQREEKQGSMQKTADSRPVSLSDWEWWTSIDEGYWEALLAQGQIAPEVAASADPHEIFRILDVEPQADSPQEVSAKEQSNPVLASAPGAEEGWQVAQRALDQGELFCLLIKAIQAAALRADPQDAVCVFIDDAKIIAANRVCVIRIINIMLKTSCLSV